MELPVATWVDAAVFDITGRRVAGIASGVFDQGRHSLQWDGLSPSGAPAVSGVYYLRVATAAKTLSRTFVVMQ